MKQIFWMSYAYTWCNTEDPDTVETLILTDVHAPETCRTNLVVQDLPSFGKDFGCRQGVDPMYPMSQDSCVVW